MNRASSTMLVAACLSFWAGCASTTSINESWSDSARPRAPLGKTLAVAVVYDAQVASALEQEWARQLRERGVDAKPLAAFALKVRPPGRQDVVALAQQHGFDTVLVSRRIDVKQVERDVSASQVAVVETKLYDARTEQPFWSARTDTFLDGASVEAERRPGGKLVRTFVETLIAEMARAKLF